MCHSFLILGKVGGEGRGEEEFSTLKESFNLEILFELD